MNQKQLLEYGKEKLKQNNIEEHEVKAKKLLEFILCQTREEFITNSILEVSEIQEDKYKQKIDEIVLGKPLQYITNNQEFMGLNFYIDENVLIPQPDTEILVEQTINLINKKSNVLDLCTGSGAIGISIAKYARNALVVASDISEKALEVAKQNATQNQVENKMQFIKSDMFSELNNYKFDVIVSNPPYIETRVIPTLSKEVQQEPLLALDGGKDGLDFYRTILIESSNYLNKNGYVLIEIGYDQGKKINKLWSSLKQENKCKLEMITKEPIKDFGGNDRVIIFRYKEQ